MELTTLTMENINALLNKLMLNRAALLIKRYDAELKDILRNDLHAFKAVYQTVPSNSGNNKMSIHTDRFVG